MRHREEGRRHPPHIDLSLNVGTLAVALIPVLWYTGTPGCETCTNTQPQLR